MEIKYLVAIIDGNIIQNLQNDIEGNYHRTIIDQYGYNTIEEAEAAIEKFLTSSDSPHINYDYFTIIKTYDKGDNKDGFF